MSMRLLLIIYCYFIGNMIYGQTDNLSFSNKPDNVTKNRIKHKKQIHGGIKPDGYNIENKDIVAASFNEATLIEEQRKKYLIKKYGFTDGLKVFQRLIYEGMTTEMVLDSKGIPYRVNRNVNRGGTSERWIYPEAYLFFENGILTNIVGND